MTATTDAPVRPRTPRSARAVPLTAARMLRIELRRSPMPWILPLIAALLWFDSYRPSITQPPIWVLRTFWNMGQGHTIIDFGPFVAGMAAWIGSRDGRRGMGDLVTATARPRWVAQLVTWAAAAIWAVGGYLLFVGVMFGVYAHQGVAGSPPWWWVAVGAVAVAAFSAAGFAAGVFFPSRFAAPLAAFGGFLACVMSSQTGFSSPGGWALILPTNSNGNYEPVSGVFYRYLPDLPIARVMFLAGIAVAVLGLLGLPARAGGPGLRRAAAVVTLAGVAAAGTAIGLAGTAWRGPHGIVIPALHDAANDRPIPYTPVCGRAAGVPVCLNPAYRRYLPDVTAALRPVLAEVAGLPGAPARATQVPGTYTSSEGEGGPGGDDQRQAAGAPPAARRAGHPAGLDRLHRRTRDRGPVRWPGAGAVRARVCGRGQRRRNAGPAGGPGGTAAGAGVPFATQAKLLGAGNVPGPPPGRRPARSTRRPGGWPRCRPPPGTPGSPPTWARCGPGT